MAIRVLLADDHPLMRDALRLLLDGMPGVEVVAEATSGAEALRLARELAPEVVVLDVRLPDLDGVEAARALAGRGAGPRVVAVSASDDPGLRGQLAAAGAFAFVFKGEAFEELPRAVRAAAAARR